jgi:hypothetical protein
MAFDFWDRFGRRYRIRRRPECADRSGVGQRAVAAGLREQCRTVRLHASAADDQLGALIAEILLRPGDRSADARRVTPRRPICVVRGRKHVAPHNTLVSAMISVVVAA